MEIAELTDGFLDTTSLTFDELDNSPEDTSKEENKGTKEESSDTKEEQLEDENKEGEEVEGDKSEQDDNSKEDDDSKQEDEKVDDEGDVDIIDEILTRIGYKREDILTDDDDIGEDYDGVAELTNRVSQKIAENTFNSFFEQNPVLAQFAQFIADGGNESDFTSTFFTDAIDYSSLEIDSKDIATQERVVRDSMMEEGYSKEDINEAITEYKDKEILEGQAKRSLKILSNKQEERKENLLKQQANLAKEQEEQINNFIGDIKKTIDESNEIGGVIIPKTEKEKFKDYITKPVDKEGNTQRNLDLSKINLEQKIFIDYLLFKKLDISDIVDKKARKKNISKLKEALNRKDESKSAKNKEENPSVVEGVDLDSTEIDFFSG